MVNILENMLIIDGKKYYKHNVFNKYAASKDGSIIKIKTKRIIKMINCNGYLYFNLCDKNLSKPKISYSSNNYSSSIYYSENNRIKCNSTRNSSYSN